MNSEQASSPNDHGRIALPYEILVLVFESLSLDNDLASRRALRAACLASREWRSAATPALYASSPPTNPQLQAFLLTACHRRPDLGMRVRRFDMRGQSTDWACTWTLELLGLAHGSLETFAAPMLEAAFAPDLFAALARCTRLQVLDLEWVQHKDPRGLLAALNCMPRLRVLTLPFDDYRGPSSDDDDDAGTGDGGGRFFARLEEDRNMGAMLALPSFWPPRDGSGSKVRALVLAVPYRLPVGVIAARLPRYAASLRNLAIGGWAGIRLGDLDFLLLALPRLEKLYIPLAFVSSSFLRAAKAGERPGEEAGGGGGCYRSSGPGFALRELRLAFPAGDKLLWPSDFVDVVAARDLPLRRILVQRDLSPHWRKGIRELYCAMRKVDYEDWCYGMGRWEGRRGTVGEVGFGSDGESNLLGKAGEEYELGVGEECYYREEESLFNVPYYDETLDDETVHAFDNGRMCSTELRRRLMQFPSRENKLDMLHW